MDLISHSHWLAITKQRKSTKKITNEDLRKKTSAHKLIFGQNLRSAFPSTGIGNPLPTPQNSNHPYYKFQGNSRLRA